MNEEVNSYFIVFLVVAAPTISRINPINAITANRAKKISTIFTAWEYDWDAAKLKPISFKNDSASGWDELNAKVRIPPNVVTS